MSNLIPQKLIVGFSYRSAVTARLITLALALLLAQLCGCAGERRQFLPNEIPQITSVSAEDEAYGHEVLGMMMDEYSLDRDDKNISRVRDIIDKLVESADSQAAPWHVYVIKDDSVENAGATRGNYIFVWTGMLKKVHSDEELAAVLAHELAHVLAGHTQPSPAEEFASIIAQVGGEVSSQVVYGQGQAAILADLAGKLTEALISAMIVNPEQQRKELEADQLGLFLMAKAKYDPEQAVAFWERMQKEGFGDLGAAQFFSSHPSSDERIEQLRQLLPEAKKLKDGTLGDNAEYGSEWTITTAKKVNAKLSKKKEVNKPKVVATPAPKPAPTSPQNSAPEPW